MGRVGLAASAGVTMLELLVTVAIAAIVLAIAAPSFQQQIEFNSRRSVVADFITAMAYARAESVKRGDDVYLRSVTNDGSWIDGWCVTTETACGSDDIRRFEAVGDVGFKSTDQSTSAFTFNSQGFLASTTASVSICQSDSQGKKITVTPLGQALAQDCTCTTQNVCGG